MNIKTAKDYYRDGLITCIDVLLEPMSDGCYFVSLGNRSTGRQWNLQTALGATKVYSTADSVLKDVQRITGAVHGFSVSL